MSQNRIEALESRIAGLEVQVASLRRHVFETTGAPAARPTPVVRREPPPRIIETPRHPPLPEPSSMGVEAFFGGRLLLGVGVLAFLFGVAFFLKYAFDNGWVGPTGRVIMGLIGGVAIAVAGEAVFRRGYRPYAAAITALGASVLYLSLWAAGSYFHLVPLVLSFGAMIVVSAAAMAIAMHRNDQRLAIAALTGALITPPLNTAVTSNLTGLLLYLAVVNAGVLWLPARRWPLLEALAFAGTQLYVFIEMPLNVAAWSNASAITLIFGTVFLLQFAAMPLVRAYRTRDAVTYECAMVLLSAGLYFALLFDQLFNANRDGLTAASIILAIVYTVLASGQRGSMRQACTAVALAFVTAGIGIGFTGAATAIVWSFEGAALLIAGTRRNSMVIRGFGYTAYVCALIAIQSVHLAGGALFINERFVTLFITAIGLAAVAYATRGAFDESFEFERHLSVSAESLAHVFVLIALGYELNAAFTGSPLALSLLMLVYAAGLVAAGFIANRIFTRWEGLALFGALVIKVFFVDLSSLDTVVRIVSFLAVGSVLLAIAFLYQRVTTLRSRTTRNSG